MEMDVTWPHFPEMAWPQVWAGNYTVSFAWPQAITVLNFRGSKTSGALLIQISHLHSCPAKPERRTCCDMDATLASYLIL